MSIIFGHGFLYGESSRLPASPVSPLAGFPNRRIQSHGNQLGEGGVWSNNPMANLGGAWRHTLNFPASGWKGARQLGSPN